MPGDEAQPQNAVGIIGRIEPFEDTVETWTSYTERLEQYFEVNDIAEDKKVPALLTLLGGKTYTLLRNLTAPNKPKEKDYTTLVNLLRDHLTPKPIVIAERFRFHKRNQLQCESVNAYIAELRKLTEFCEFGLNLNDTLRDRFVCGLRNDQIQKKLLTIRELSLDKALEIAVAMETATKDAIELRNVQGDTPVHKVRGDRRRRNQGRSQPQQAPKLVCYRCNGTDHLADKCRFKESTCNQCHVKDIPVQHVVLEDKRRNLNIEIREYMHSTMKKMMILRFTVFIRMEMILFGLNRVSMGMLFLWN